MRPGRHLHDVWRLGPHLEGGTGGRLPRQPRVLPLRGVRTLDRVAGPTEEELAMGKASHLRRLAARKAARGQRPDETRGEHQDRLQDEHQTVREAFDRRWWTHGQREES